MKCDWLASNFNKAFFNRLDLVSILLYFQSRVLLLPYDGKGAAINSKHMSTPPIRFLRLAATDSKIFDCLDLLCCFNIGTKNVPYNLHFAVHTRI